jgi:O-antigen/teichoic acid export membrane protein
MQDLKQRTLRGGFVKICAQAANFVLRVGSLVIMARLLDPKDFGLVAMATVITGVFTLFRDAGLSTVTIQRRTITDEQLSTLFWLNMLVGLIFACVIAALAPILVAFYHEPRLLWVTLALATGFIFNAAGVQHSALLQRRMRFGSTALVDTIALLASVAVGIGMAMSGAGYWALVGMTITVPIVSTAGFWLAARWLPGLPHRGVGTRSMMRFGSTVTLNSLIVYAGYNMDKLLLGRFGGAEVLGIYGRGYQLISFPTDKLNSAVGSVAVSALSRLQDNPERFRRYFLKGYSLTLAMTVPLTIFCALFADDIILVLLSSKWREAAPIFRYLAPTILVFTMINPLYWLLVSTGHVGRSLKMAFVIAPLVILASILGVRFGATGVAISYSTMMVLLTVPMIVWATNGLIVTSVDILKEARAAFLPAFVASAVGLAAAYFGGQSLSPLPRLVLEGGIILTSYVGILLLTSARRTQYLDLIREFSRLWSTPRPVESAAR